MSQKREPRRKLGHFEGPRRKLTAVSEFSEFLKDKVSVKEDNLRSIQLLTCEEAQKNVFVRWCSRTSCHGFSDFVASERWGEKLFWISCLIVSFLLVLPQLYLVILDFVEEDDWVSSTFELAQESLQFPIILLCNYNRINQTKAEGKYGLTDNNLQYINRQFHSSAMGNVAWDFNSSTSTTSWQDDMGNYQRWRDGPHSTNVSFSDLLWDLGHSCDETIFLMVYNGERVKNPCSYSAGILTPNFGKCFAIRLPDHLDPVTRSGPISGVKLVLNANLVDYETGFIGRHLDYGMAMYLYYSGNVPQEWISLAPGFHHWIEMMAEKYVVKSGRSGYFFFLSQDNPCAHGELKVLPDNRGSIEAIMIDTNLS